MRSAQTFLYFGYLPDVRAEVDTLAREWSEPPDRLRRGPLLKHGELRGLRADDAPDIIRFCGIQPISPASKYRSVILDLTDSTRQFQTALLILTEQPPSSCRIVMFAANRGEVMSTIISRSQVKTIPIPSYGQLLVDLSRQGVDLASPAALEEIRMKAETWRFSDKEMVPDNVAVMRAEGLLEAAQKGDLQEGLLYAAQFNEHTLAALRQKIASAKLFPLIREAYAVGSPQDIAVLVFQRLYAASRRP